MLELFRRGWRVEPHDGVRDLELVLHGLGRERGQVKGCEVPVVVREGPGELVGLCFGAGVG